MAQPILLELPRHDPRDALYERLKGLRTNMPRLCLTFTISCRNSSEHAASVWEKFGEVTSRLLYPAWRVRLSSRPSMPMRVNVSINDHRFKRRPVRRRQRFSAEKLSLLKITLSNLRNKSMTQTSINTITPINRDELVRLCEKAKANPGAVRTLKVKTVLESKFRHLNYIRNLAPRASLNRSYLHLRCCVALRSMSNSGYDCHLQLNRGAAHLETDFAIKSGAKSPFCS